MGKNKAKRKKEALGSPPALIKENISQEPQPKSWTEKLYKIATSVTTRLVVVVTLIGAWPIYKQCKDDQRTTKEKFDADHKYEGDLEPSPLVLKKNLQDASPVYDTFFGIPDSFSIPKDKPKNKIKDRPDISNVPGIYIKGFMTHPLVFVVGSETVNLSALFFQRGFNILNFTYKNCTSVRLYLGVKDDYLYASAEFKDLVTGEVIGNLKYNHWTIFNQEKIDFRANTKKLEVYDKQGQVVFAIHYDESTPVWFLTISGYFGDADNVLILNSTRSGPRQNFCVSKSSRDWVRQSVRAIEKIDRLFD